MPDRESYDPSYFPKLAAIEDRHFWFRARNRAIGALVAELARGLPPEYRVLEAGCGTGNALRVLEQVCPRGSVIGMDLFPEGLRFARRRVRCPLVAGDMARPPFRTRFELIGLFDVLEHHPDDAAVLAHIRSLLAPGGKLVLTVPAHPSLWSYFDEESRHCRRYEERELRDKLAAAGFQVDYLTPYMAATFPLMWAGRRLASFLDRRPRGQLAARELRVTPGINGLLALLLAPETRWIARRKRLPMGSSLLAVATAGPRQS
jgi:SAM-dependent methyltransferase